MYVDISWFSLILLCSPTPFSSLFLTSHLPLPPHPPPPRQTLPLRWVSFYGLSCSAVAELGNSLNARFLSTPLSLSVFLLKDWESNREDDAKYRRVGRAVVVAAALHVSSFVPNTFSYIPSVYSSFRALFYSLFIFFLSSSHPRARFALYSLVVLNARIR